MSLIKNGDKFFISDDAYVFSVYNEEGVDCCEHKHDFIEMVYMLKGKCVHLIDGQEYPVRHGDLVIINYNQTHNIVGDSEIAYINILMKPEYISKSLINQENSFALLHLSEFEDFRKILDESKCKVSFVGEERHSIEGIINAINKEIQEKAPGYELAIRSQLNILIIMIFRKMSFQMDNMFDGVSDRLLSYINQHCHENITLKSIAGLCSYNQSYFSRIFKSYTGLTLTEYIKRARIKKAVELLETTESKVTDIVYAVGYTDKTKFYTHFKSIMGETPLQHRKSKK